MAEAMQWVARITTIGLEMVVPTVAGRWADERFHTSFLAPVGLILGLAIAAYHLWGIVRESNRRGKDR